MRPGEFRVNLRPFVGRRAGEKVVEKNHRFPLAARVVDDLSARRPLHAAREDGRRNDIRERGLRRGARPQAQGNDSRTEEARSHAHAHTFFPECRHNPSDKLHLARSLGHLADDAAAEFFRGAGRILGSDDQHHAGAHVEDAEHFVFGHTPFFRDEAEDVRHA